MSVWAIIAAAGRGERLGFGRPKAFAPLGERPLLAESLERLDRSEWIDAIALVAPAGWEEPAILLAEELGCGKVAACIAGGATRNESVRAGLAEVADDAAVVLVHDAARPLVSDAVVERLLTQLATGWDGVVPALPVADTVKRVDGEAVVETLERESLVTVQTPQAFVASSLRAALAAAAATASDCAAVVERDGGRVGTVVGDRRLLKITDRDDLELVESWL